MNNREDERAQLGLTNDRLTVAVTFRRPISEPIVDPASAEQTLKRSFLSRLGDVPSITGARRR